MNILAVSGFSALALVLVHSITFVIGRRLGRYNVVDVAWGVGFVAVAVVAALFGHGDPTRRWLLLALVAIWGLRLSWHSTARPPARAKIRATPIYCAMPRSGRRSARSLCCRAS